MKTETLDFVVAGGCLILYLLMVFFVRRKIMALTQVVSDLAAAATANANAANAAIAILQNTSTSGMSAEDATSLASSLATVSATTDAINAAVAAVPPPNAPPANAAAKRPGLR
jgi:hypothetical protein